MMGSSYKRAQGGLQNLFPESDLQYLNPDAVAYLLLVSEQVTSPS